MGVHLHQAVGVERVGGGGQVERLHHRHLALGGCDEQSLALEDRAVCELDGRQLVARALELSDGARLDGDLMAVEHIACSGGQRGVAFDDHHVAAPLGEQRTEVRNGLPVSEGGEGLVAHLPAVAVGAEVHRAAPEAPKARPGGQQVHHTRRQESRAGGHRAPVPTVAHPAVLHTREAGHPCVEERHARKRGELLPRDAAEVGWRHALAGEEVVHPRRDGVARVALVDDHNRTPGPTRNQCSREPGGSTAHDEDVGVDAMLHDDLLSVHLDRHRRSGIKVSREVGPWVLVPDCGVPRWPTPQLPPHPPALPCALPET